jgi:hypothetical protein
MQSTFFIALKPNEEASISGGSKKTSPKTTTPSKTTKKEFIEDNLNPKGIYYKQTGTYTANSEITGYIIYKSDITLEIEPKKPTTYTFLVKE